jgi:hypothetical protein
MRVLCNYTYKNNGSGENYSITLEKMGDLRDDQVDEVMDELFAVSRGAVQRQIDKDLEFPPKDVVTIPKPKNANGKPQMRDPEGPATGKQKFLLSKLARQRSRFIENIEELSKAEASSLINELMAV